MRVLYSNFYGTKTPDFRDILAICGGRISFSTSTPNMYKSLKCFRSFFCVQFFDLDTMDEKQDVETIENGDFKDVPRVAEDEISHEQRQMESRIM